MSDVDERSVRKTPTARPRGRTVGGDIVSPGSERLIQCTVGQFLDAHTNGLVHGSSFLFCGPASIPVNVHLSETGPGTRRPRKTPALYA